MDYLVNLVKYASEIKDAATSMAERDRHSLESFDLYNDLLLLEKSVKSMYESKKISKEDYDNFTNACEGKKFKFSALKRIFRLLDISNPRFSSPEDR